MTGEPALEELRARLVEDLQTALELEHATIPAYLCALYSIPEGTNVETAQVIHGVVMEEMLHLVLVANVLNAVGGEPQLAGPDFVPRYPTRLPHSDGRVLVRLRRFSPETVQGFLAIERPEAPESVPMTEGYHSIGQFYQGIEARLRAYAAAGGGFSGDLARQVPPGLYYYGGAGDAVVVHDLDSALHALTLIVDQGEGLDQSIHEDVTPLGAGEELAHFFRFQQIALGQVYRAEDSPLTGPTGRALPVDWGAVLPMRDDPLVEDLQPGSQVRTMAEDFNERYADLLRTLHRALNGDPALLVRSVPLMVDLKWRAVALMKVPVDQSGRTAGPSFEWPQSLQRP